MYAVMGASGHIGHEIAKILLNKGKQVRLICRSKDKIQDLISLGGIPLLGDANDANFLTDCFHGCDAIFCMIPPDYQAKSMRESQKQFGQSIFDAIKNSGCKKVVNLSSVGAESDRPTGPVKGLYDQEVRLSNHKEVDIIHLRPTYFLENFFGVLELIKTKGILGSAINADAPFYTIATKDIAQRAAKLMMNPKFKGHTHLYLLGVKRTTLKEIAQAFSKALGKKLKYIHFGYDETKAAMMGMGFSEDAANNMVELSKAVNDGILFEQIDKNHDSFTKTTPEEFAKIYFKPLF